MFSFPPEASTPMCLGNQFTKWVGLKRDVLDIFGSFDCFFLSLYLTINCGILGGAGAFLFLENLVVSWSLSDIRIVSFNVSHFKFCYHIFPSLWSRLDLYLWGPLVPKGYGLLSSSSHPSSCELSYYYSAV